MDNSGENTRGKSPLHGMRAIAQWINWKATPDPKRPGKTIKKPVSPHTETVCDPTNPSNWTTYEAAKSEKVGFVFTKESGYWFIDIDNCLNDDNTWSKLALNICARFAGAAVEVSQSGRGLHLFGRGIVPPHTCRNTKLGLELYTDARFCALTQRNITGNCDTDHTAAMATFVVEYFTPAEHVKPLLDAPLSEWIAPTDYAAFESDDALITIALKAANTSLNGRFGGCTFADLWDCEHDKLAERYANETGGHDASACDLALASHLAYWTAGNPEAIERLMMQSQLHREKWDDRPKYLTDTIAKACATVKDYPKPKSAIAASANDLNAPVVIKPALRCVPPFDAAFLPTHLAPWCIDIASRMSVPLDMVAIPAIVQAGALIGRRIGIRPEKHTNWLEVANLWGCIVASPGSLKSPVFAEVLKPVNRLELQMAALNDEAQCQFNAEEAVAKIQSKLDTIAAKNALKIGNNDAAIVAMREGTVLQRAPEKRYLVNDATVEKLGEICADNPDGILIHRDEVMSLFGELDRTENQSARGFFLSGWGGQEGYTFDRIGRGTVRIAAVNLSLIGTTQPDRLKRFINDGLHGLNDGMVQRLQLLSWPDPAPKYTLCEHAIDANARDTANACYAALASLQADTVEARRDTYDDDGVPYLHFADDAQPVWNAYRVRLENKLRYSDLSPALASHFAKYRGLIPRLALIMHLAGGGAGSVSLAALNQALALAEYLEAHAHRAYAAGQNTAADSALKILSRIKRGQLASGFTARDVKRPQWTGLTDSKIVDDGITMLVDHNWIEPTAINTGGRASVQYAIHPNAML